MNYRHQFHAGNFADVWKHCLLIPLIRGMQRKDKGFLFLDTHAGRGAYDLSAAARGDSLERTPEHPDGFGRLSAAPNLPGLVSEYVSLVKEFNWARGGAGTEVRYYPGSPWITQKLLRDQDRLALCELHPEENSALKAEFAQERGVSVQTLDGYTAIRAMLPPLEKRAMVLIDPSFEEKDEFDRIVSAVTEALRRMPAVTIAVWYPLTQRAGVDRFFDQLLLTNPPPCFTAELMVAGEDSSLKMKGCGLLVLNPPWQIEREFAPAVEALPGLLAQGTGGGGRLVWLVREK
ncbi:23S rRNA (adenine(2030)-N(6))-methyltransferase RlmJ [Opitutaceae bacterium EW11]|nr:23S rRNA (adenine(2030)-N(6))-methyltransferase RlmJ [Opitutaceae bacterium EW11]